ncbi:MAG TPA: AMP-binding protein [Thalassobaculum sp.]
MTPESFNPEWQTIGELIRSRGAARPDDLAVEVAGRSLTYGELDRLSDRVAANLAALGIAKGERVANFAYNSIEQLLTWFGCMKIGAVWVPLNIALTGGDLAYSLDDAAPRVLVVDADTRPRIDELAARRTLPLRLYQIGADGPEGFASLLDAAAPVPEVPVEPGDPAVIIYTGGTTGMPKGVELPQFAWIAAGYRYIESFDIRPDDVHYSVLALFHNGGLMIGCIGPLVAGIPTHIERWFSLSRFWPRVRETGATVIDPIGTMVTLICQQPEGPGDRDHNVRVSIGVLGQVPATVATAFRSRFGFEVVNVYSLSETGGVLIVHNKGDSPKPDSNGKGWGWCELAILDPQDRPLPAGATGEICLRPTLPYTFMLGYFNKPERTVECWRNLWLHTGDLGYLDEEGYLFFTGRQAHWLRTHGENVSAYEVESVLSRFRGVEEVIVVGVPADLGEEDVKAFVRVAPGSEFDPESLLRWAAAELAAFKLPRYVEVIDDFPRSAAKREVERHKLKALPNDGAWDAERVFGRRRVRGDTAR